jgi:CarD family transcriptional regulator
VPTRPWRCRVDRQLVDIEKTDRAMNFDGKAKADSTAEAAELVSQRSEAHGKQRRFGFTEDDFIVYPAHGVGQIVSIEEQIIAGVGLEFFVIYFAKAKLTVRVPTRKAANVGMRSPSDPASIHRVKRILGETARRGRGTWSRLALEYASKINSGDIAAITEVVRDLYRPGADSGQSFSERQLYETALDRLSAEMALVDGISKEQSVENVEGLLRARSSAIGIAREANTPRLSVEVLKSRRAV